MPCSEAPPVSFSPAFVGDPVVEGQFVGDDESKWAEG